MKLGAFSVSLSVKDVSLSKSFYENLGFAVFAGAVESNYLIMKNENALIGLFQGMFEDNILTFNPGWDENANDISDFDDVRTIQNQLKDKGISLDSEIEANTTGPASLMLTDPDGNVIYIDQHSSKNAALNIVIIFELRRFITDIKNQPWQRFVRQWQNNYQSNISTLAWCQVIE